MDPSPRTRAYRLFIPAIVTAVTAALVLTGCGHSSSGVGAFSTPGTTLGSSTPASTSSASTTSPTGTPTTPGSTTTHPNPVVVTAHVSAFNSSYTGLCPASTGAPRFSAVITVSRTPATVTFHWQTSNGASSDPSPQTLVFHSGGPHSMTVSHTETSFDTGTFPTTLHGWVAVDVTSPSHVQSNHVNRTITCVPFSVGVVASQNNYSGPCPPPTTGVDAVTFTVTIIATQPVTVTYHWQTSNGGDSDPSTHTATITPGTPFEAMHVEAGYLPGATTNDYAEVVATVGSYTATSDHSPYTITCT